MKTRTSRRALRPLLFLGSAGIGLLVIDLIFIQTNLALPSGTPASPPPFALTVAQTLTLLLLAFPALGFYNLAKGRVTTKAPFVLGGVTLLAAWLSGGGSLPALLQGAVYGLGVLGIVHHFYGGRAPSTGQADRNDLHTTPTPAQPALCSESDRPLRLRALLASPVRIFAGYGAFGVHLGIGLLFLWIATWFGATSDDSALRDRIAASPWPWLLPLVIGLSAAIFEELVFRKWLNTFLYRFTRSTVAIAFLSSSLWSLTHLQYSVSPWYLRIIEIALFAGPVSYWLYKRYGLTAAILGHFLYNAFLVCCAIVQTQGIQSAWVFLTLLLPLLPLLIRDFRPAPPK